MNRYARGWRRPAIVTLRPIRMPRCARRGRDAAVPQQDGVLDLGASRARPRRSPCTGRCRRLDQRARPDDRRAAHRRAHRARAGLDHDAPLEAALDDLAVEARLETSRIRRLASSMSSRRPVSFHQPVTTCGSTRRPRSMRCWMASVISSSPRPRRLDRLAGSRIAAREHVDADQGEVAARLRRLLDQAHDAALPSSSATP